jgi:hypothetical protein
MAADATERAAARNSLRSISNDYAALLRKKYGAEIFEPAMTGQVVEPDRNPSPSLRRRCAPADLIN